MEDRDEDAAVGAGFPSAGPVDAGFPGAGPVDAGPVGAGFPGAGSAGAGLVGAGLVGAGLQPAPLPNRASHRIHTARRALYIGIYRLDAEVRFPLRSSRSSR
jgi:hypothetical protein